MVKNSETFSTSFQTIRSNSYLYPKMCFFSKIWYLCSKWQFSSIFWENIVKELKGLKEGYWKDSNMKLEEWEATSPWSILFIFTLECKGISNRRMQFNLVFFKSLDYLELGLSFACKNIELLCNTFIICSPQISELYSNNISIYVSS